MIVDQESKKNIIARLSTHFSILEYYDKFELSTEEFLNKYGHVGIGLKNFIEIRFYPDSNILLQIKKILGQEKTVFVLPVDKNRDIYKYDVDVLENLDSKDLVISDLNLKWVLITNRHNKLTGIGAEIKNKIEKMISLSFNGERLMHAITDKNNDKEQPSKL